MFVFFFKQKTAYEMRISYWSSDVCSSDLNGLEKLGIAFLLRPKHLDDRIIGLVSGQRRRVFSGAGVDLVETVVDQLERAQQTAEPLVDERSEEHTSELQSLMRNSYAVFCLKKKNTKITRPCNHSTAKENMQEQTTTF